MGTEFVEEIEGETKTSFNVSSILVKDLKAFQNFCKEKTGNNYSMGINLLMEVRKQYETLIPLISNLQSQIDELKSKLNDKLNNPGRKTWG